MKRFTYFAQVYKGSYSPKIANAQLVVLKRGFDLKIQYAYEGVKVITFYNRASTSQSNICE
jgi:hypothetical protein